MTNLLRGTNLYLIGMMGVGKTTVGRLLASQLDYRFLDTDELIEQTAKKTISQIFADQGEAFFRQLETQVLSEVYAYTRLVVATGGGIVLQRQNWGYLHHGIVVWLDAPIDQLRIRLQGDTSRPLLDPDNLGSKLETLLEQRQRLYAQADMRVTVAPEETPMAIANRTLAELSQVVKPETAPPSTPD